MNNIRDVLKKLQKNNSNVTFDSEKESIIFKSNQIKIECDSDIIILYFKNKEITHKHFEVDNFDDIYDTFAYFIKNAKKIKKEQKIINFLCIIITIILGILLLLFKK